MNKKVLMLCAVVGSAIGGYVPVLFGDNDLLSGWSILGGMIGGFVGIWLGVKVAKQF